jgi:hypothetical protein
MFLLLLAHCSSRHRILALFLSPSGFGKSHGQQQPRAQRRAMAIIIIMMLKVPKGIFVSHRHPHKLFEAFCCSWQLRSVAAVQSLASGGQAPDTCPLNEASPPNKAESAQASGTPGGSGSLTELCTSRSSYIRRWEN